MLQKIKYSLPPPTVSDFIIYLQNTHDKKLNSTEACKWLCACGFRYRGKKKHIYFDGHEREDVIAYRQDEYCPQMLLLRDMVMIRYEGEDMDVEVWGELLKNPGQIKHVLVVHDEVLFHSKDNATMVWTHDENGRPIFKGKGDSVMVSGFASECVGFMRECMRIIEPSKHKVGNHVACFNIL